MDSIETHPRELSIFWNW